MTDEKEKHKHDWFPVAVDYNDEFIVLECSECHERAWRNAHPIMSDTDTD